jgi:uncharacterized membrane protein HdeD (DUF308 family)
METTLDRLLKSEPGNALFSDAGWLALRGALAFLLGVLALLFPASACSPLR